VLVELGVAEQRYRAVLEVLDEGATVTDVARRYGVARQTVHGWLRRYANQGGLAGLADRSSRPESCPHQMSAVVEAQVVRVRREHPSWGPSRASRTCSPRRIRRPRPGRWSGCTRRCGRSSSLPMTTSSRPWPGLQEALDAWVNEYNTARPHQSCGGRPPIERFRLPGVQLPPA
jgi:transposase-like protein